jgi:hypothetical protein
MADQEQQQQPEGPNLQIGGNFLNQATQVIYEQQPYQYEPKELPGKPKVINVAETFSAPPPSGVIK